MDVPQDVRMDHDSTRVWHQPQVACLSGNSFHGTSVVGSRQDIEINPLVEFTSKHRGIETSLFTKSSADIEGNGGGQICHALAFRNPLYILGGDIPVNPPTCPGAILSTPHMSNLRKIPKAIIVVVCTHP